MPTLIMVTVISNLISTLVEDPRSTAGELGHENQLMLRFYTWYVRVQILYRTYTVSLYMVQRFVIFKIMPI